MALKKNHVSFKDCKISFEDDTIIQYHPEGISTYSLSKTFSELIGCQDTMIKELLISVAADVPAEEKEGKL